MSGLGSKMAMDPTNKWPGETHREWGHTMPLKFLSPTVVFFRAPAGLEPSTKA